MKFFLIALLLAYASADVSHILKNAEADATILQQELNVGADGQYKFLYETSNGIYGSEQGALKNPQSENAAEAVQGVAKWTSPEGQVIELTFTADENGFQPQGSHLPTPPPIPEAIVRSLQYIAEHPPRPES